MRGWQWWHLILISRVSRILFARSVKHYYSDDERPALRFVGPCKRFCPVKSICQSWRKFSLFGQLMWELTQPPHVTTKHPSSLLMEPPEGHDKISVLNK